MIMPTIMTTTPETPPVTTFKHNSLSSADASAELTNMAVTLQI